MKVIVRELEACEWAEQVHKGRPVRTIARRARHYDLVMPDAIWRDCRERDALARRAAGAQP
jgi:hypothetical protein